MSLFDSFSAFIEGGINGFNQSAQVIDRLRQTEEERKNSKVRRDYTHELLRRMYQNAQRQEREDEARRFLQRRHTPPVEPAPQIPNVPAPLVALMSRKPFGRGYPVRNPGFTGKTSGRA